MSLESILMIIAPVCVFTAGVLILPIIVNPRRQSRLSKRYIRGLKSHDPLIKRAAN